MVADSAYKTPWICKCIFESGRILSTCYTRPKTKENGHPWWAYVYDEYFDDVICPEYRALHYSTTNRDGYREYKSRAYLVPFPVSWTVKMKKKQKETQDILSYHSQAAGCSDKARAKASGGRQPIEECGRTGL